MKISENMVGYYEGMCVERGQGSAGEAPRESAAMGAWAYEEIGEWAGIDEGA